MVRSNYLKISSPHGPLNPAKAIRTACCQSFIYIAFGIIIKFVLNVVLASFKNVLPFTDTAVCLDGGKTHKEGKKFITQDVQLVVRVGKMEPKSVLIYVLPDS